MFASIIFTVSYYLLFTNGITSMNYHSSAMQYQKYSVRRKNLYLNPFLEEKDIQGDATMTDTLLNIYIPSRDIEKCPVFSPSETDDIFDVKPSDIRMVIAFGDSISAGFGANSTSLIYNPASWKEYRGQSFSMGGDDNAISIAKFISHYLPENDPLVPEGKGKERVCTINEENEHSLPYHSNVYPFWNPFADSVNNTQDTKPIGSSKGERYLRMCLGGWCPPSRWLYNSKIDNLNAAISGSESDALDRQFEYIQERLQMVTLFIGMNDICSNDCKKAFPDFPNSSGHPIFYKKQVMNLVERFTETYPKTIVNLVQLFDVSTLDLWTQGKERCARANWLHRYFCPCSRSKEGRKIIRERVGIYNQMLKEVWEAYTIEDEKGRRVPSSNQFAVILSPTLTEIDLETDIPIEFLSQLDCFHPSILGQQSLAIALWYRFA